LAFDDAFLCFDALFIFSFHFHFRYAIDIIATDAAFTPLQLSLCLFSPLLLMPGSILIIFAMILIIDISLLAADYADIINIFFIFAAFHFMLRHY
jgi:hypothetical protein